MIALPAVPAPSRSLRLAGDPDDVTALLARSRQRSLELHRLDPAQSRPRVLSSGVLRDHREPLDALLRVARSGMESLYQQIRDVGYVVLLTDMHGVAVDFIHNPSIEREARRAGLAAGGCWTEDQEGTCAIGMALIDRVAMTVHHDEHFCAHNRLLTCSAAPIFDTDGRVRAVLDASALQSPDDRRSQHLVLSMVTATARLIENADFLRRFDRHIVLRTSSRRELIDVATDGLIALDAEGHVVAANQGFARHTGQDAGSLVGVHVEELFGLRHATIAEAARQPGGEPLALRLLASGSLCWALVRGPRMTPPAQRPRAAAVLPAAVDPGADALSLLAGEDPRMQHIVDKARRVQDRGIAVLLQGESGTGKEAFAKAMHAASQRAAAAFVALNCAAIPESLIESELFGHSEGAFTGARAKGARGKIVQAHGGTLFLDEIGDMPLAMQTRLLRVLSEREVVPLGAERAVPVDVQLICATHRDLQSLVDAGGFRLDLYYRLNGLTLSLPPLRERLDKEALIERIVAEAAAASGAGTLPRLTARARALLLSHPWPGNIRQLHNVLRAAIALSSGDTIDLVHLPADLAGSPLAILPPQRLASIDWTLSEVAPGPAPGHGVEALRQTLQRHHWNISDAARSLGLSRSTVYRQMARHGIVAPNHIS
jgi:sigma-54 dependent transcriptional regulator, acetoin dehydrogenase operon transcriptional activator AcoR